jgi:CBS domain-containing protein
VALVLHRPGVISHEASQLISHKEAAMKIRDVMVHDVVAIDPSASLAEAAQLMREANVGILPVVEDGQVCGVITDRDLVVRAIAVGADLASTPVGEFATGDPVVAHPDWNLDQAMEAMARAQIGRLPVIDDDNVLAGIVTLGSLALRSKKDKETLAAAKAVSRRSVKEGDSPRAASTHGKRGAGRAGKKAED